MAFNPKYEINMVSTFERAYANVDSELRNALRPLLSRPETKRLFATAIIDEIRDRTVNKRIDKNGRTFAGYSESYADSLDGQIGGKVQGSPANLRLSGEMMASMELKSSSVLTTVIGMIGQENKDKADGHITGMRGRKGGKVRDFFGLPKAEEARILRETISTVSQQNFVVVQPSNVDVETDQGDLGISVDLDTILFQNLGVSNGDTDT